jgi:hypothetical protein
VFRGQYLPLSLSKRGVPYIKKTKRKKKASAKQKRVAQNKKIRSAVVRFYQTCELIRFYQGWKLVRSCLSVHAAWTCPILLRLWTCPFLWGLKTGLILLVRSCRSDLSDFTKAENLSVFTRAENWFDLTCLVFPRAENLSGFPTGWELVRLIILVVVLITINPWKCLHPLCPLCFEFVTC